MKSYLGVFSVALLTITVRCTSEPTVEPATKQPEITTIHNIDEGLWNNSRKIVLKPLVTIGVQDSHEQYAFAQIGDIAINSEGTIYVSDMIDHCIKAFDSNGNYIKTIGQKGQGPGEFSGPINVEIGPQDKIYVMDAWNKRVVTLDKNGVYLSSFPLNIESIDNMLVDHDDGSVYLTRRPQIGMEFSINDKIIHKYNSDGSFLFSYSQPNVMGQTKLGNEYSFPILALRQNNDIVCGYRYPYQINIHSPAGKLQKIITRKCSLFLEPKVYARGNFEMLMQPAVLSKIMVFSTGSFLIRIVDFGESIVEEFKIKEEARRKGKKRYNIPYSYVYDLLDSEGRLLQSFKDPLEDSSIFCLDDKGFAYILSAPDGIPIVSKCIIRFEKG